MNFEKNIPSSIINSKLKDIVSDDIAVGLNFKKELKNASGLFLHLLITHAEEITKENHLNQINISSIREALVELDFLELMIEVDQQMEQNSSQNNFKRSVNDSKALKNFESLTEKNNNNEIIEVSEN